MGGRRIDEVGKPSCFIFLSLCSSSLSSSAVSSRERAMSLCMESFIVLKAMINNKFINFKNAESNEENGWMPDTFVKNVGISLILDASC